MYHTIKSLIFFLLFFFFFSISQSFAENIFLGYTAGLSPKTNYSHLVKLPVFIKFPQSSVTAWVERESSNGTKSYCMLSQEKEEFIISYYCNWKEEEIVYELSPPPSYLLFFLSWQEDQTEPYTLKVCFRSVTEEECQSISINPSQEDSSSRDHSSSEAYSSSEDMHEESPSNNNNQCVWNGSPGSNPCHENENENENSSQETITSPLLNSGQQSNTTSSGNVFLNLIRNRNSNNQVQESSVWNGYVSSENNSNSSPGSSCNAEVVYLNPSSLRTTLHPGQDAVFRVFLRNGCNEKICNFSLEGDITELTLSEDWLQISVDEQDNCRFLKVKFTAPENPGTYRTSIEIPLEGQDDLSLPISLNVIPEATSTESALYMEPEKFYYVTVPPGSTYHIYFYGCSGPGGFRNRIVFSVEESSYYHQGALEPIVRFVGDHIPSDGDYPNWEDYQIIKEYIYDGTDFKNLCPHTLDAYYADWSDWYGHINPAYSDFYYCMGYLLTRYLEIYTTEEDKKCGYWAVTLFNSKDETRESVRLRVEVAEK